MITYLWAVGIIFTILVFAGKAGLVAGSLGIGKSAIIAIALLYGLIAFFMGVVLKFINPLDYFQFFQKFMAHGVILHFFLSIGLAAWGVYTMKTAFSHSMKQKSWAGYALMLPCPICLSAMLLNCSILVAVTAIDPLNAGLLMALLFMVVIAGVALTMNRTMKNGENKTRGPMLLGFLMVMVGLYFAVSIIIVPLYAKARAALTVTAGSVGTNLSLKEAGLLLAFVSVVFGLGFLKNRKDFGE